jgi:hypothetical protein
LLYEYYNSIQFHESSNWFKLMLDHEFHQIFEGKTELEDKKRLDEIE